MANIWHPSGHGGSSAIFRWGIFGTGAVSAKFISGLSQSAGARPVMVASRSRERAESFAAAFGIERAIEGYEVAAASGGIDAVYIATPPVEHLPHALACIEARVPVLIEKPFATNEADARAIAGAARRAGIFCMEGMWTRFLPAAQQMAAAVREGRLGEIRQIAGSFGISNQVDRAAGSFDPDRGGGALAHLGVYPLSLAQWLFGAPEIMTAVARVGETGVDEDVAIAARYGDDVIGSFHASLRAAAANDFGVAGTRRSLSFRGPIFRPYGLHWSGAEPRKSDGAAPLSLAKRSREHWAVQRLAQVIGNSGIRRPGTPLFYRGNGYHYEADEVARCVRAGRSESDIMPLDDSVAVIRSMDQIRAVMQLDSHRD